MVKPPGLDRGAPIKIWVANGKAAGVELTALVDGPGK
jgi:hypothetical protein